MSRPRRSRRCPDDEPRGLDTPVIGGAGSTGRRLGRSPITIGAIGVVVLAGVLLLSAPAWTSQGLRTASPGWPVVRGSPVAAAVVRDPAASLAVARPQVGGGMEVALVRPDGTQA